MNNKVKLKLADVRGKYVDFFSIKHNHSIIRSVPILPENDPTTLFINSGMQPLLNYFLGDKHPMGDKLVNYQKCVRADDIDDIGDNRHTTFFEMLGNWSLGDYFKDKQLNWVFTFLTGDLGIEPDRLYVSVFGGDTKNKIPKDTESSGIWIEIFKNVGIEAKVKEMGSLEEASESGMGDCKIFYYSSEKNWWSRVGKPENMPAGEPGGPDSEIFYLNKDTPHDIKFGKNCHPNCDCGRFIEIGNSVFMQYIKSPEGTFSELPNKNVDFGGGLERLTCAANDDSDIFGIDVFQPIISKIETLSDKKYSDPVFRPSFRIIADHLRASYFIINDGATPSNTGAGYILRRLIRRSSLHAQKLGINTALLSSVILSLEESYISTYPELSGGLKNACTIIDSEILKFNATLESGMKRLSKLMLTQKNISGNEAYILFTTYGFPIELIEEITSENNIIVDKIAFIEEMNKHKATSRQGGDIKFKGGLAGGGDMETKFHTATHLLHQALKEVLGNDVSQKGSNITSERLRFDFSYPQKMSAEQLSIVEDLVNDKIKQGLDVSKTLMATEDALSTGVTGLFQDKYDEVISVYSIGNDVHGFFSKEICGGPHVLNTASLGVFKIQKEEAVSSGIRRIKAILI